jgi:hypothetical protein
MGLTLSQGVPYASYVALLSQAGGANPTAVVLENTLGFTPTWIIFAQGYYYIDENVFDEAKTFMQIQNEHVILTANVLATNRNFSLFYDGGGYISLQSADKADLQNGLLSGTCVEIRVYP